MKKIKYIVILIISLICCGCSVDYNVTINEDMTVNETLYIKEVGNDFNEEERKNYLDSLKTKYGAYYDISLIADTNYTYVFERKYYSYNDYKNSTLITDEFGTVDLSLLSSRVNLIIKTDNEKCESILYNGDMDDQIELNVNFHIPFKVINSNAEDVVGNTYKWYYDINKCDNDIELSFSNNTLVSETGEMTVVEDNTWKGDLLYLLVGVVIIGLLVFWLNKTKKNES
ncbi:MAG: hypothetical protein Q4G04_03395 [bacterium]|nr:hypothetical protein [bacterium]